MLWCAGCRFWVVLLPFSWSNSVVWLFNRVLCLFLLDAELYKKTKKECRTERGKHTLLNINMHMLYPTYMYMYQQT